MLDPDKIIEITDADRAIAALATETMRRISLHTAQHQQRVGRIAHVLARSLGLRADRQRACYYAGLLHDYGKIVIPMQILDKPSSLLQQERSLMELHADEGAKMLLTAGFNPDIVDILDKHHERLDGRGYPRGLPLEEISIEARIVAVADVYEALTAQRMYRSSMGVVTALLEMWKHEGTFLDGDVLKQLEKITNDETLDSIIQGRPGDREVRPISDFM